MKKYLGLGVILVILLQFAAIIFLVINLVDLNYQNYNINKQVQQYEWIPLKKYLDKASLMRSHVDDFDHGNAWYYEEIKDQPEYLGRTLLVKDITGIKIISKSDVDNYNSWYSIHK